MTERTTEFILGLIGGIFGFFGALIAIMVGGLGSAFGADGASQIVGLGWGAVLFSILGIIGSVVVKHKSKLGGIFMIIAAIGGIVCISFFYVLSFVLLMIGGLMGVLKKDHKAHHSENDKKLWYTRWWMIIIYVLVGLIILGSILPKSNNTSTTSEEVISPVEVKEEPIKSVPQLTYVEENNDKVTIVPQSQEIAQGVIVQEKNTNQIVPIGKSFEHTQNGYTLIIDDYTFEKKTDTYGELKDITFIIKNNQGSNSIIPQMTLKITDKKNSKYTVYQDIDLSEYIEDGESIKRTVVVDLGIGAIGNVKEMGIILVDWGRVIDSVYSNVNFSQQPSLG